MTDTSSGSLILACVVFAITVLLAVAQIRALRKWNASMRQLRDSISATHEAIKRLQLGIAASSAYGLGSGGLAEFCLGIDEYLDEQERLSGKRNPATQEKDNSHD